MKRTISRTSSALLAASFAILGCVGTAAGQQFHYANIWVPGSTLTVAFGINDSGVVAGFYETMNGGAEYGFMKAGQSVTTIDYPGAANTICYGINNAGDVVGGYIDADFILHAFLYESGIYTNIDPPGATSATASGINNLGQIVGAYQTETEANAFILDGNTYQVLQVTGAAYTIWAGGINDSGEVSVQWQYADSNTTQSSVYDGANYTQIQIAGAYSVFAYGINNQDNIAISWQDDNLLTYGTLRIPKPRGGYFYPSIEVLGGGAEDYSTYCYGVNNKGVVVGRYVSQKGELGFAAIPNE